MGMTLTEKIIAAHTDRGEVHAGELVTATVDLAMGHDITAPHAAAVFKQMGATKVWDPEKVVLVNDHFVPAKDIKSAELSRAMRNFAKEQGIPHYFEIGRSGICHTLLPQEGLIHPGQVVIGADSHSCTYGAWGTFATGVGATDLAAVWALGETWLKVPETIRIEVTGERGPNVTGKDIMLRIIGEIGVEGGRYKALEFAGPTIEALPMGERIILPNMAIEAGAKNGVIQADDITLEWLADKTDERGVIYKADPDAQYEQVVKIDITGMPPVVAFPFSPDNIKYWGEWEPFDIDQVVIGSCTNGRIEDIRAAAGVMKGKQVHPRVRVIVFPATQKIYQQAMEEGLLATLAEAGCAISTPTCGSCVGGHMGVLAGGEKCVSTTNRNFRGRMGDAASEVYLTNPAIAAATAVAGRLALPEEV
ncbi:MAG TPA: 3-isopropylmalate dehydratase large subunit [bacterium]|nr:3-isopropylmalate dehydratase large subunit [bacterium]